LLRPVRVVQAELGRQAAEDIEAVAGSLLEEAVRPDPAPVSAAVIEVCERLKTFGNCYRP